MDDRKNMFLFQKYAQDDLFVDQLRVGPVEMLVVPAVDGPGAHRIGVDSRL